MSIQSRAWFTSRKILRKTSALFNKNRNFAPRFCKTRFGTKFRHKEKADGGVSRRIHRGGLLRDQSVVCQAPSGERRSGARHALGGSITEGISTTADWGNLIGLAIVPTMISLLTLAVSSRYIGPTKTSILGVFEPLTAIMIGTLLFGEPLTLKMGIGVAVCVGAVVFMILKPGQKA